MIEININDFSLKPEIYSKYFRDHQLTIKTFNLIHFNNWVKLNYDINDSSNYIISHRDILKSNIEKKNVLNKFGEKITDFIEFETSIKIKDSASLMGISIPLKTNTSLIHSGKCFYSLNDLYINCLLLEQSHIINNELKELLLILKEKLEPVIITPELKHNFIQALKIA